MEDENYDRLWNRNNNKSVNDMHAKYQLAVVKISKKWSTFQIILIKEQ